MKKTLLISLILLCAVTVNAQPLPYPTDTIKGKIFYRYPVQKGEGLYRISKNFSVSQEDIVKYNPELQNSGLKLGQTILIPAVLPVDSSQYVVHELQPKETLYGISRLYGVKIAQIQELNPETSKTMRIGERLLIPKTDKAETAAQQITSPTQADQSATSQQNTLKDTSASVKDAKTDIENTAVYVAAPDSAAQQQVLQHIKQLVEESFAAKDSTKKDSLTLEHNLTLPADTLSADSLLALSDSVYADTIELPAPLNIAVFLPLMTNAPKRDASVERFMEFYEGLLLAVNRQQAEEQHFLIRTYDTDKTESRILSILADSALQDVDLIIGPAYPAQVSLVSEFSKQYNIPMIVPFTSRITDIYSNPWLLQFNPTEQIEAQSVATRLKQYEDDIRCIAFNDDNLPLSDKSKALREEIRQQDISLNTAPVNLLLTDSASYLFDSDRLNVVLLQSDKYSVVQNAISHLERLQGRYRICLVSEYAWQKEKIALKQIYTDLFDEGKLLSGENLYYKMTRKIYFPEAPKNDSPRYDLLGYDLMTWAANMLAQTPESLPEKIAATGEYVGLQSALRFEKVSEEGGWMNYGIKVIGL